MAWQEPKTDWDSNPKNPKAEDLNRIEANINFLKNDIESKKGLIVDAINTMGQTAAVEDDHATLATKIKDISDDANALTTDVLPGKTFYQGGTKKTGDMPTKAAQSYTPGTASQIIAADQYLTGVQTILGDSDLLSTNIKAGASIFGVAGNSNVVDTSPGTAVAAHILSGYKAFVNGSLLTGTIPSKSAQTFTPGTTSQAISAGQYLSGTQTIAGSGNLVAGNIKTGVNIFGVVGNVKPLSVAAGDILATPVAATSNTATNMFVSRPQFRFTALTSGTLKVSATTNSTSSSTVFHIQFYKNNVAYGSIIDINTRYITFTQNVVVASGDVIEARMHISAYADGRTMGLTDIKVGYAFPEPVSSAITVLW